MGPVNVEPSPAVTCGGVGGEGEVQAPKQHDSEGCGAQGAVGDAAKTHDQLGTEAGSQPPAYHARKGNLEALELVFGRLPARASNSQQPRSVDQPEQHES